MRRLKQPGVWWAVASTGGILIAVGMLFSYLLERHSFRSTQDLSFAVLVWLSFPVVVLGSFVLLVAALGLGMTVPCRSAFGLGITTLLTAMALPPILQWLGLTPNVHGWAAPFMLVILTAGIAGAAVLLTAVVRALRGIY